MRVAELRPDERPREKLLAHGPAALTEVELLAVLLRTGRHGEPVLELARRWLDEVGGLVGLARLDIAEILRRRGVGPAKGTVLAAALELGRRLAQAQLAGQPVVDRPELVAQLVERTFGAERVEVFGCLTLDARHRLRRCHELHRGGRTHADVEPAEVFHRAIVDNANAVVLWHTHPSGDPTPSDDDLALTRQLVEAGRLLNVAVLDHEIVGGGSFVSLRQRGQIPSR